MTPDARSDIYSLGATLWYLLCGKPPHAGRAWGERPDPGLPLEHLAGRKVPRQVTALLRSMLATDPAERPQSARELLTALQRCRQTVQTSPHRRKQLRRAALAVAVLSIAATGLATDFARRQRIYRRSVAVLPLLDLDTASASREFTKSLSNALQVDVARFGASRIVAVTDNKFTFPGVGTPDDIRAITSGADTRAALTGTVTNGR